MNELFLGRNNIPFDIDGDLEENGNHFDFAFSMVNNDPKTPTIIMPSKIPPKLE